MIKRWIIAGIVMLAAATLLLPQLAADSHFLLLREVENITFSPAIGWKLMLQENRVLQFYLLYAALTALLLIWALVSSNYLKYRSDMQRITPDIETPCAAGQGQFGTARWMKPEDIGRFFAVWKVPKRKEWFQRLIAAGKTSYKEVKDSNVQIDINDEST